MTARHNVITTVSQTGWLEKHTFTLAELYVNLESLEASGYNPRALMLYHAVVCRQWYTVTEGRGTAFNINEKLLNKLENRIRDSDQEELRRRASNFRRITSNQSQQNRHAILHESASSSTRRASPLYCFPLLCDATRQPSGNPNSTPCNAHDR